MSKDRDRVQCQHCGKSFSKAGITNHEKACPENPENKIVEEVVEEVEVEIEEVIEEVKKEEVEELCEIRVNSKVDCYIGDRYHRYAKGEVVKVTKNVKDVLKRAGLLEAL